MEILADSWGYTVSISSDSELRNLRDRKLEGEILQVTDKEPFNIPTGKRLTLKVDPSASEVEVGFHPKNADWHSLERIDVRISPNDYNIILYSTGRVYGVKPRLPVDIIIQDANAV